MRGERSKIWFVTFCQIMIYVFIVAASAAAENQKNIHKFKRIEPSIKEVHRMAIEYAQVTPEKINTWRKKARWKAIMPKVSVDFSRSEDENIEIYKNSTLSYVVRGPREVDTDWGVDLTWDLSDLVWNDVQTSIDVRGRLMVKLRNDILEDVTRLYFERKKLLDEIEGSPAGSGPGIQRKRLRAEELTAYLDALTGGKFSE